MDPPPAPTERTSTHGVCNGIPTTAPSYLTCGRPSTSSAVSKLVPPTSPVIASLMPSWLQSVLAPTAPATGPDITVSNGRERASVKVTHPPEDVVMRHSPEKPSSASPDSSRSRYADTVGRTYASMTVVEARSYSRYWPVTWCESETGPPKPASRR